MKTAKRVDEFTPKEVIQIEEIWLSVELEAEYWEHYKNLPEIVDYNGSKFYKMSYNSDVLLAYYKEAKNKPYHLRYS